MDCEPAFLFFKVSFLIFLKRGVFMPVNWDNVMVGSVFTVLGGVLGFIFMLVGVFLIPKILNKLTPNIDEEKEIIKGNMAVARYFGGIVQATIVGMSIIIAAAVIAGLHG